MQARYYDPVIGRFYSNDPVGTLEHLGGTGGIHGFNRYAYANNNPYAFVDPDGNNPRRFLFRFLKDPVRSVKDGFRDTKKFLERNGVITPSPTRKPSSDDDFLGDVPVGLGDDSSSNPDDEKNKNNQFAKRNKKEKNKNNPNKGKTQRGDKNVRGNDPETSKAEEKADGNRRSRRGRDKIRRKKEDD